MIPYYLKMEVGALGFVQVMNGELDFLLPGVLLGGSGFRKKVAGRRPTVLARAPRNRVARSGRFSSPQCKFWEGPLEESSAGVCKC